jgi:glycosyltransferase involved in cell wall biosynthesis
MNKGIILSTGSVIGFVNADDYYGRDNILEDVVNKFISNKIDILYGNICYIHPQTKKMIKKLNSRLYKLNYRMSVYHPSVFMKKEIYKMKLYSLKYKIASDYELLLSCKITKLRFKYLDRIIVYMREGGASYKNKAIGQNEQNIIIKETYSNKIFLRKFYLSLRKFSILYNKYLKKFFLLSNVNSIIL